MGKSYFKSFKEAMQKAAELGVGGVEEIPLQIFRALSGKDKARLRKSEALDSDRIEELQKRTKIPAKAIEEALELFLRFNQRTSKENLRRHGIKVTPVEGGLELHEYDEDFS